MATPINARDLLLQQTIPRVLNISSNFITLISPNLESRYTADNNPNPAVIEITAVLSGILKGQAVFEITGLLPNTALVLDSQNSNKLLLNPNTFATDIVTVTAKLNFEGVEYVSVPVTAFRTYTNIVTRLSRSIDNVPADVNGNSYTLPAPNFLELYNGVNKLTAGVVFGPSSQTSGGLTCSVNSSTGQVTLSQLQANAWVTDYVTFNLTATRNFVAYTVPYTVNKIREGGTGIDPTPPPTPTNFTASAAINTIIVQHGNPTYTVGSGHNSTVLYGKVFNTGDILTPFNPNEIIAEFTGNIYTLPSEPGTTWRLWARWKSRDGFLSTVPAGGTNGIQVTTGQDVSKLLDVLTGELTESQLYSTLTGRINLIDDPNTGLVKKTNDLVTIYGNTVNSSINATNAATSATNAAGSASTAATALQQVRSTIRGTSLGLPLEQWNLNGQTIVDIPDGRVGTKALRLAAGGYPNQGNFVPLDLTKKYRIRFWARPSANAAGTLYFSLRQFLDEGATPGPVNGGRSPYKPSAVSRANHIATYGNTWGEYNFLWDSGNWQQGVKFVQPEFLDNYSNQAGHWDIQAFTFTDVTQTEELTATVQTLATTTAGPDGATAQFTVKTDVNGNVAGFGLSNTVNIAGAATSEFIIIADRFAIAPVNTSNTAVDGSPFFHRTAPTIINGVAIPAGTYMKSAFIHDASITNAKILDLSADKITAGFISAARFQAGSITADKIDSRGLSIRDAAGNIILAAGTALSVSNISGLGGLATRNSLAYSEVGGTKPPADADRTAINTAAGIANQGSFATLSQITPNNVSTYIASAAIGDAQVGSLNANKITAGTISANIISGSVLEAMRANINDLSSLRANLGNITAGRMQSPDGLFVIDLTNKFISISV